MVKIILNVNDMMCSMCEAHINNYVRKKVNIKKIKSNHKKKETVILAEDDKNINDIIDAIKSLGYSCELKTIEEK